ncbi:hypothetical protein SEA_GOCRAZY_27 [Arthrobacter phage GoCrazy]|uniref:Uncharacterized protein n=1 Tax=Arthrobacter phage KeaneyLin TaxID=2250412 RepID=A0A345KMB3_9CAUD|nr:hypothetical protein PQB83_gp27 [Arthrobacter phage KeaneyLin]AXH44165.1 hypothetical protein SEA_KEANEYLIN_27 [Arthrobacter phage KeaneyLin]QXO13526.1 hypothetical protein SEA_GOCRAZY_27 [Arthrobacter phage GoCrazy]
MEKSKKQKLKEFAKKELPWIAMSAVAMTAIVVVFKNHLDTQEETYREHLEERNDIYNHTVSQAYEQLFNGILNKLENQN